MLYCFLSVYFEGDKKNMLSYCEILILLYVFGCCVEMSFKLFYKVDKFILNKFW